MESMEPFDDRVQNLEFRFSKERRGRERASEGGREGGRENTYTQIETEYAPERIFAPLRRTDLLLGSDPWGPQHQVRQSATRHIKMSSVRYFHDIKIAALKI